MRSVRARVVVSSSATKGTVVEVLVTFCGGVCIVNRFRAVTTGTDFVIEESDLVNISAV